MFKFRSNFMCKGRSCRDDGFTLVELMVAIAIMALLTGIIVTNLTTSKAKARDAKRISDIGQLQLALEFFFDRCRQYPPTPLDTDYQCPTNSAVRFENYISKIPLPPAGAGQIEYFYVINGPKTDYVLRANLETETEIVKDGLKSNDLDGECRDVPADKRYCIGPK